MSLKSVHEIVREAEDNYIHGTTQISEHVDWSMHDTIERVDAYLNSKHTSGETDSLGREKPFFNIVTAAVNIVYRATDLDRKNIRILPDKTKNTALAFIATVHLQNWMKKNRFGTFLNLWGRTLARYGSAVVKFVERDGELVPSVVPWNRLIVDPVDFNALPRIEKFYKTPAELIRMATPGDPIFAGYDLAVAQSLIEAVQSRQTLDGFNKDNQSNFIELYEVHGELDSRCLDDDPNLNIEAKDLKYRQQMHVISFVQEASDKYNDFCLYKGKEKRDPYMITHLIEEDGRTLAIGAVELLFDAQWMANHTVKNMKDTLDLASKLIFQTADKRYLGRNVLSAIETGDIFHHEVNMPLTRLANDKPDVTALQGFLTMFQNLGKEVTSTPDAIAGNTLPSGTPYSLGAYLGGQAGSLFEIMTENKGLAIEDMMRQFILPHLMTKMDSKDEIVATLDDQGIAQLDAMYIPREAVKRYNKRALDTLFSGGIPSPYAQEQEEGAIKRELSPLGNQRFFKPDEIGQKTWKEALEGFVWEVDVEVTNENTDKQAVMQTLVSTFQTLSTIASSGREMTADERMVLGTILTETGRISPLQLSTAAAQPTPQPTASPNGGTEALSGLISKAKA